MKKVCFGDLPVCSFFLFRGQRFKKLDTSLASDAKSSRILFDRGTEVETAGSEETSKATSVPDFSVTDTKMFTKTIVLTGDAWTTCNLKILALL
jgi:hypothetical protein